MMKKYILVTSLLIIAVLVKGQNYNPFVAQAIVSPSPINDVASNGTGVLSFLVGNSGDDSLTLVTNQEMTLVITLSRGIPNNSNPLAAIGGSFAGYFNWLYDSTNKSYFGIQNQNFPGALDPVNYGVGEITISYKVTSNSVSTNPQNGFNVNLTPPAYTNGINTVNDDFASSYTWTVPTCNSQAGPDMAICLGQNAIMNAVVSAGSAWSIIAGNPGSSNIANSSSASTTISGFTVPGNYFYKWTNASGCSDTVIVQVTAVPASPVIGLISQPTCLVSTGSAEVSSPAQGTGFEYAIDGGLYQSSNLFSGLNTGTHTVTIRSIANNNCISQGTSLTINAQPTPPPTPTISSSTMSNICPATTADLNSILTSSLPPGSNLEWYTNSTHSGMPYASSTNAVAGTYYAFYVNPGNCYSTASQSITVIINSCCVAGNTAPSTH